jgi:hypothetical protein
MVTSTENQCQQPGEINPTIWGVEEEEKWTNN